MFKPTIIKYTKMGNSHPTIKERLIESNGNNFSL
jgi:hypothetical protein